MSSEEDAKKLCSLPCFSSYKFCNNVESVPCDFCHKELDVNMFPFKSIHVKGLTKRFCSQVRILLQVLIEAAEDSKRLPLSFG